MTIFKCDDVSRVYSGRKGCACGCRGKYSYATKHADKRPDYLDGQDGISDRSVKLIANRVLDLLHDQNASIQSVTIYDNWIGVDMTNDRMYTVYFD